jgi:hypothetical protein
MESDFTFLSQYLPRAYMTNVTQDLLIGDTLRWHEEPQDLLQRGIEHVLHPYGAARAIGPEVLSAS